MGLAEEVEALRRVPLFANIEPSKLKLLAFTSERRDFAAGDVLFRQDDVADSAYLILEGRVDVQVCTPEGPLSVATLGRHTLVGEIGILCDMPRTATIVALTPVLTMCIAKDMFFRLATEFPQMAVEIMRELALRLERTTRELSQCKKQRS